MSAKSKGTARERRSRAILEAAGYEVVRAAGSHGVFDLVGFSSTDVVLVQVKSRDWPGTVEAESIRLFPVPPNTRKLVHRWRDHARAPDVREVP